VPLYPGTISTVSDLLAAATAELYEADPEEFTQRRQDLVTRARDSGEPAIAKQIAALRKPTRAAWVVNRLVRTRPEVVTRLSDLATELRAGGDGARIRELTESRGRLVDELTRQAFSTVDIASPPAALREDVIATLGAALADPEVATNLAAGTLTRAAYWAGFGLVPLTDGPPKPAKPKVSAPAATGVDEVDELERRRRLRDKVHEAERTVVQATQAAESASMVERQLEETVAELEEELEQARLRLAEARRAAYRSESRRRKAQAELDRIRE
jgi:hypothetical protein